MLTIGYIGNGKSVNRYHLPFVLQRKNKIKVKSIYSRNIEKSDWAKLANVNYTNCVTDIMDDEEIDVVVICTMQDSHYEYAKMALDHGKNVLVEKPFMMTYEQAKDIFAYAKTCGKIIQCFQNRRYDSDFLTVQKVIHENVINDIFEVEIHFDYYRPETPERSTEFKFYDSYLYGHGCHTIDQVISYFGIPKHVNYDVRCLCGKDKMSDYFDLDLIYSDTLKVSVKSSYFRVHRRPSFVVYGKRGMFVKENPDRQESDLKKFYMPGQKDFGVDQIEDYGTLTYVDDKGVYHEEKVVSEKGDYGRVYDALYDTIVNGKIAKVSDEETLCVMEILETGAKLCEARYR